MTDKHVKPLFIDVIVGTDDPDAPPIRTNRINFHSATSRKWLDKHTWWALHEGHTVHLRAVRS